jgi:hypothetical protein
MSTGSGLMPFGTAPSEAAMMSTLAGPSGPGGVPNSGNCIGPTKGKPLSVSSVCLMSSLVGGVCAIRGKSGTVAASGAPRPTLLKPGSATR